MERQVFKMPANHRLCANLLVTITSCEDRGDFYYVSYCPIQRLDGKVIQLDAGSFGAVRIKKDGPKPERLPIFVRDCPEYGVGQVGAFTRKGRKP